MENSTKIENGELIIVRAFDAPREQVWLAWMEPEPFSRWWGPKDFTAPEIRMDFEVGGKYVWCMRGAGLDGKVSDYWSTGEYTEIVPLEKLAYTDAFADPDGNKVPASYYNMPGVWPLETMVTVTFEDIDGSSDQPKTKMTLRHEGLPDEVREMCGQGWDQSFDKLEKILPGIHKDN